MDYKTAYKNKEGPKDLITGAEVPKDLITGAITELVYNPNGFILFHKLSRLVRHHLHHDVEVPFDSDTLISIKNIPPPLVSSEEVVTYLCKVVAILRMSEHYDRKKIRGYLSSILQVHRYNKVVAQAVKDAPSQNIRSILGFILFLPFALPVAVVMMAVRAVTVVP